LFGCASTVLHVVLCGAALFSFATPLNAAPFVPQNDAVVLQSGLPTNDARVRQMRAPAAQLKEKPEDLDLAMRLADRQLAMGLAEADPRFVGYARATLARWWDDARAPSSLLVLRARIQQAQHDFAGAAATLKTVLRNEPTHPEALLLLATIAEATGELKEAASACAELGRLRVGLVALACSASVASLTGRAEESYTVLRAATARSAPRDAALLGWVSTILGEIAMRTDDAAAERHFRDALALIPRDIYARTVLADYLLDRGQGAEVLQLLSGFERVDALLLRLALAARVTGDPKFERYREDLAARFAAARRRGDEVHLRDAARFALEIEKEPATALELARRNWARQRSLADARVLLEAAIAAREPAAGRPVAQWTKAMRVDDRTTARLLHKLGLSA
jgi:hypothetical protein